jgi:hypothetical protein
MVSSLTWLVTPDDRVRIEVTDPHDIAEYNMTKMNE